MSFFDEGEAPEDGHKENLGDPLIESEDEVFALARRILPSLKDAEEEHLPPMLKAARRRRLEKAEALSLVAKWADYKKAKGHISIHDPGSGDWADLPYKAAPSWAQREARKRSAERMLRVKMAEERPWGTSLWSWIASSRSSNSKT